MQKPQRKSSLPAVLFLLVIILGLAWGAAVSLNRVRNGEGSFLSNLWAKNAEGIQDPYLSGYSEALQIPPYVKTIMLLGSDYTPQSGYRTDVMLLAAFNLKTNEIHLFSLPRDLWVEIPGYYPQRLNVAHALGGYQLLSNLVLFIPMLIWGRKYIGVGSVANMAFTGYAIQYFAGVITPLVPDEPAPVLKMILFVMGICVFALGASLYMTAALGTAPTTRSRR